MQFTVTCRRCGHTNIRDAKDAQTIRGLNVGQPRNVEPPLLGYIVKCPHCGTESVVRPEQASGNGP